MAPPYFDTATHLVQQGNPQWGIVHETGNYPGAWWLDPYQVWYELPAIADADNADLLVVTHHARSSRAAAPAGHPRAQQAAARA